MSNLLYNKELPSENEAKGKVTNQTKCEKDVLQSFTEGPNQSFTPSYTY